MSINNPQLQLTRGTVVHGQYRIERELGRGAMGVVYLATQLNLDRPVALKVFSIEDADVKDPDKLFNEARAAGALSHINIVQVYSAGRADSGIGYFAMEYIAGETLGEAIKRQGHIDVETSLKLAQEVANALEHGWQRLSLTHGDIKPDNVMLTQDGVAKLADFGLARAAIYDSDDEDLRLTPLYAAPEMITGEWRSGDCHADMYSFGATLYHMVVGQPPFPGRDPQNVMHRQVHDRPVPLAVRKPGVPAALSGFVDNLLAKNPTERPESWGTIGQQITKLRSSLQEKPQSQYSGSRPHVKFSRQADPRRLSGKGAARASHRKSVPLLLPILLLLIVVLAFAILVTQRLSRSQEPTAEPAKVELQGTKPAASKGTEEKRAETSVESDKPSLPNSPSGDLDTARALAEERQMAPTPEGRTKSLSEELERMETEDETPSVEVDPNRKEADDPTDDDKVDPDIRERLAVEAYSNLMAWIVGLQWNPGTPVPASLHAKINEWIETYGSESSNSAKVWFLKTRLLPAAEEFIHHLVLRHEHLRTASLPGEEFSELTVAKITRKGVEMVRELRFGRSITMYKWPALCRNTDVMIHLGTMAFGDPDLPLTELRPFLATLFLAGRTEQLAKRLRPLSDKPEASLWNSLAKDYEGLLVEKRAATLWQAAKDSSAQGNQQGVLRALEQLRELDTRLTETHAEEIEQLERRSYQASPQSSVARETEEILRLVDEQPAEALAGAAKLFMDFGALDFPEKIDAVAARRKASNAIIDAPHFDALLSKSNSRLTKLGKYCLTRMRDLKGGSSSRSSSSLDELLYEGLRAGVLLDMGDWLGSVQIFPYSLVADHAKNITPADHLWLGHIAVRLANRYSPSGPSGAAGLSMFDDVAQAIQDDETAAVEAMNHAFALGLECGKHSFHNWKTGRRSPEREPGAYLETGLQEQFLLQSAWMLMHEYQREAQKMTAPVIQWANAVEELPSGPFIPMLRRLHSSLTGETPLDLSRMPQTNQPLTAPFWRAALSEILLRAPQTVWDHDLPSLPQMAAISGTGALKASLWPDLAVLKIAGVMADGDMAAAAEMAAAFEENLPRDAMSFRPELRFYRVGIELFRGRRAAAADLLQKIVQSGLAAPDERQLAEFWHRYFSGRDARFSPAGKSRRAVYFHLWLKSADKQSEQTRFARVRALKFMAERAPTPARVVFCRKLTILLNNS